MKNFLFAAATMVAMTFASCNKNNESLLPVPDEMTDSHVRITLTDSSGTRVSSTDTVAAEAWEKALSSLSIFTFDNTGSLIVRHDFSSEELAAKSATFSLPKSVAGTSCAFYAVANFDASAAKTEAALTACVESAAASYNGTFAEVSTKALRAGGFVMTGMNTLPIGAVNTTTDVPIRLSRTVAKVAVRTTVDPTFVQKYGGTITVNSVMLSRAASQTLLFYNSNLSTGAMDFTHTQVPAMQSSEYSSLFYCYENGVLSEGDRVLLEIHATYDLDGNDATTDDRSEVVYPIELTGKEAGRISRNSYYRIAATITGLIGLDCSISVTATDWESPITQTVELGA